MRLFAWAVHDGGWQVIDSSMSCLLPVSARLLRKSWLGAQPRSALPETRQAGRIARQISCPSLTTAHQDGDQIHSGRGQRGPKPILGGLQEGREGAAYQFRLAKAAALGLLAELGVERFGQLERSPPWRGSNQKGSATTSCLRILPSGQHLIGQPPRALIGREQQGRFPPGQGQGFHLRDPNSNPQAVCAGAMTLAPPAPKSNAMAPLRLPTDLRLSPE